jgi:hypothetical protein
LSGSSWVREPVYVAGTKKKKEEKKLDRNVVEIRAAEWNFV